MNVRQLADTSAASGSVASGPALSVRGISKTFGPVQALKQLQLDRSPGRIHALMGENGAGKSTLVKVLAEMHLPTAGQIFAGGAEVRFGSPRDATAAGVAVVHQELLLFGQLTVAENIFCGHYKVRPEQLPSS